MGKLEQTIRLGLIGIILALGTQAFGKPAVDYEYYRSLTLKLRDSAVFRVPTPNGDWQFEYKLEFGEPIYKQVKTSDMPVNWDNPSQGFWRTWFDRVWLKDGSYALINGEQVPLTCVFIRAQDNRYTGKKSPVIPDHIVTVYIVANDYTCKGPLKPGWPGTGGNKENWDTYIHYEVRDPTIMLPMEPLLRYRWAEFKSFWVR